MARFWRNFLGMAGAAIVCAAAPGAAAPSTQPALPLDDLTTLSLEDLMNVEVTSVSKKRQRLADAPAAIHVISQDDIRRSGASTIPDLLRMAPGLQVAQLNANKWAVSARGFNDFYANKLLVLMDGRTLYQPLFSGVYWQAHDYLLSDLDRIEVIRGPGATLWGANAVNGVINIESRSARETQGWLLRARAGTEEGGGALRYGGQLDEKTFYRVFGKYRHLDASTNIDQTDDAGDQASLPTAGFRVDRYATDQDTFTLLGGAFHLRGGNPLSYDRIASAPPFQRLVQDEEEAAGGHLLGRWTHVASERSDFSLQMYVDRFDLDDDQQGYLQDTFDIDFQHRFQASDRHELVWGLGYRLLKDDMDHAHPNIAFDPTQRVDALINAFIQDRITLLPDRLALFIGSKFELNGYTGLEVQPAGRILWTPDEHHSLWGGISRAVRTPSRFEEDSQLLVGTGVNDVSGAPFAAYLNGNPRMKSEELLAYEIGYRMKAAKDLSIDIAAFYNTYDRLRSVEVGSITPSLTPPPPHLRADLIVDNVIDARTYGLEVGSHWQVTEEWRLAGSYTLLRMDVEPRGTSDFFSASIYEDQSPEHQFQLRSYVDIGRNLELNAALFYVDNLQAGDVSSYFRMDLNVVWRLNPTLEWTVGAQNVLDAQHREFPSSFNIRPTEIERSFFTQLVWRF